MMVRWISLVPPAIEAALDHSHCRDHGPAACPRARGGRRAGRRAVELQRIGGDRGRNGVRAHPRAIFGGGAVVLRLLADDRRGRPGAFEGARDALERAMMRIRGGHS